MIVFLFSVEENDPTTQQIRQRLKVEESKPRGYPKYSTETTMKEIVNLNRKKIHKWDAIFFWAFVFGIVTDPLFLYIPIIDEQKICVGVDKNMMIVALVFRSFTDIFYIIHLTFEIISSSTLKDEEASGSACKNILEKNRSHIYKKKEG